MMVSVTLNRRRRKQRFKCLSQFKGRIIFVIICLTISFLFLATVISLSTSLKVTTSIRAKPNVIIENELHMKSSILETPFVCQFESQYKPYGCVIQPPELDSDIRIDVKEMKEWIDRDSDSGNNNLFPMHYGDKNKGAMSQKGLDHVQNQDRGIIIAPFHIVPSTSTTAIVGDNKNFLIGIFDGHGDAGHDVAQYLQNKIPARISNQIYLNTKKQQQQQQQQNIHNPQYGTDDEIKEILKSIFVDIDQELPADIGFEGGSTASIILRLGDKVYFSNVGDSLSFLAMYQYANINDGETKKSPNESKTTILHHNRFDKAYIQEEKDRIEKLGGQVYIPDHPMNARVLAYDETRKEMVSLGMSRAVGDWYHGKVGVIAEPIVDVIDLKSIHSNHGADNKYGLFVVSSSDGLYDHRKKEFVANHLGTCFFEEDDCHVVVDSVNLIDLATSKRLNGYHDDITVVTMKVEL